MKLAVLALDYDGTMAFEGVPHPEVRAALMEARREGFYAVLVTGRRLAHLRSHLRDLRQFDAVVAENGAVVSFPESGRQAVLGPPPPKAFLEALERRGVVHTVGDCVVEADASAAPAILEVIRDLGLPLAPHFNRGRVMVLPPSVSKATGLREALSTLRLSPHNAIAIGDAENDHELLAVCEIGAAVEWATPALKAAADEVIEGSDPSAVAAYIRRVTRQPRMSVKHTGRRRLLLGYADGGKALSLAVRGRNVLIAGDPRSGKSWVAGLLAEQLILHRYSVCVIDPEGDYWSLESLPGVVVTAVDDPPPAPRELMRVIGYPDISPVIDLSRLKPETRREYASALLVALASLRRQTGLPHRIVVDEAHAFLGAPDMPELLDLELAGYTLITYRTSALPPDIFASCQAVVVTRETDRREVGVLASMHGAGGQTSAWETTLGGLAIDEAVLLPDAEESGGSLRRFRVAPRITPHVRHRHSYLDVPVPEAQAFALGGNGGAGRARTLAELAHLLSEVEPTRLDAHLRLGDLSRWIDEVFGDHTLALQVREVEDQHRSGRAAASPGALVDLILDRYPEAGDE